MEFTQKFTNAAAAHKALYFAARLVNPKTGSIPSAEGEDDFIAGEGDDGTFSVYKIVHRPDGTFSVYMDFPCEEADEQVFVVGICQLNSRPSV